MKLYRFRHSPFARKVQTLLDLLGLTYEVEDVRYADREELAALTGGYVYVPVLRWEDGSFTVDSRAISERLLARDDAAWLAPRPFTGPVWATADFYDQVVEDVLFRVGAPYTLHSWPTATERALYTMNKERKFGSGCLTRWERERDELIARGRHLLAPSFATLREQPFLFGTAPTLADAALHGLALMLEAAHPPLVAAVGDELVRHTASLRAFIAERAR
ncbi:MAG: hypothetical protein RL385_4119 [Pseudomonadota bacterium]|jgi:glutathione S-transferase